MAVWLPWDPRWSIGCIESSVQFPLLVLELFPRQAIASHPHNKHCITHPQERNVHHMYYEEGPDGYNQLSVYTPRPLSNPYTQPV